MLLPAAVGFRFIPCRKRKGKSEGVEGNHRKEPEFSDELCVQSEAERHSNTQAHPQIHGRWHTPITRLAPSIKLHLSIFYSILKIAAFFARQRFRKSGIATTQQMNTHGSD